jgi:hypothetical protein
MVRTLFFLLLAAIAIGALGTPFLAGIGVLLLLLLIVAAPLWWIGLAVYTHGHPSRPVAYTRAHRFLGPGGPDDPFADAPYADEPVAALALTQTPDAPREEVADTGM